MGALERALGRLVAANNDRIRGVDADHDNPRNLDGVEWHHRLVAAFPSIQEEWDRFHGSGHRLPFIEDVVGEHQGNDGGWRAGLLVSRGRPCEPLASLFPATVAALTQVPGLRSALWSLMEAGTELPEHSGPNAGVLRYHLGVRCNASAALQVGDTTVAYEDGAGILFDDTVSHAAWNRGEVARTTLFCELERPLPFPHSLRNRMLQELISLDGRYRSAPRRAAEWHTVLNPGTHTDS